MKVKKNTLILILFSIISLSLIAVAYAAPVSIAEEHPDDVISGLLVALTIMGSLFFTLIGWWIKQGLQRLTGIEQTLIKSASTQQEIRDAFQREIKDIREDIYRLDRRVDRIDTACAIYHGVERRHTDPIDDIG